MRFIFTLLFFISANSFACEYTGKDALLILKKEIDLEDLKIHFKNCQTEDLNSIKSTLANIEGHIGAAQLKQILGIEPFTLNHSRIIVKSLNKLAKQQLALKDNLHVQATPQSPSFHDFDSSDSISLFCNSCLWGSSQKLTINFRNILGKNSTKHFNVNFTKHLLALKVLSPINAFNDISPDNIEVIQTTEIPYTEFHSDIETLKYHQTNKPLKAGDIITTKDLSAKKIIKAGMKLEIVLENSFIKIKTHGIPRSAGTIGEMIEVFHPEKNKKYYGKVIDINKVHVQL